ncbi:PilN domain-containing protein [Phosphitispora sp. TUW77]|uniref:PilN domain-containing protein n=1 Tax=Phosphitispora sp. TUW77 TaxID=3152361 RepID=UPI003AB662C5
MQNRINLLSPSAEAKRQVGNRPSQGLIIATVVVVVLSVAAYGCIFFLNARTEAKIEENRNKIEKLAHVSAVISEFKRVSGEKSETEGAVNKIIAAKPVLTKCMDEAAKLLPPSVVLRSMNLTANPRGINIKGTAPSHLVIAQFQGNLLDSEILKNAFIRQSIRDERTGAVNFELLITPEEGGMKQ